MLTRGGKQAVLVASSAELPNGDLGLPTPKRPRVELEAAAAVFPYYAGYSYEWALAQIAAWLDAQAVESSLLVLDPWNGSGTTTLAAAALGVDSVGLDLNPASNMIAKTRVEVRTQAPLAPDMKVSPIADAGDPLATWFGEETATRLRVWANSVATERSGSNHAPTVGLFRAVRLMTRSFEGSNPTWVRQRISSDEKVLLSAAEVDAIVRKEIDEVRQIQRTVLPSRPPQLLTASAGAIPLSDRTVDMILGSPPYLTRIDYGVALSRELAVLGLGGRELRSRLMGTTMIRRHPANDDAFEGDVLDVLSAISNHQSKDSSGYYLKQARQYFSDLVMALREISRVAAPGCDLVLVVQDSYYKDVHIALASLCESLLSRLGWTFVSAERMPVTRLLTTMNTAARAYEKGWVDETVLRMRRECD